MVFDKRGYVREYVIPANPNTVAQQGVRDTMKAIQSELKLLGTILRGEFKSGFGYQWNSVIIGELMANNNAALDAYVAEWNVFGATDKTAWATADAAPTGSVTDGALLYACGSAAYDIGLRLGLTLSLTLPAAANAVTVGAEWVDSTP
jgi:hypothetical protein